MAVLKRAWFVDNSPGRGVFLVAGNNLDTEAGAFYVEFTISGIPGAGEYGAVFGICGSTFDLSDPIDIDVNAAQGADGVIWNVSLINMLGWGSPNRAESGGTHAHVNGDVYGLAYSTITDKAWARRATQAPTLWYGVGGAGTADPATGVEGFDFSTQITGNVYVCAGCSQPGNANAANPIVTVNGGGSAFAAPAPSGFVGPGSVLAFNPLDKDPPMVLSNANQTLTCTLITGTNQPTSFARTTQYRQRA